MEDTKKNITEETKNNEEEINVKDIVTSLTNDFSQGQRDRTVEAMTLSSETESIGLIERLISMSENNNVLVVATDDESNHIASCTLPVRAFTTSPAQACWKFASLRRLFDEAEEHGHATVSIIRYNPNDEFSGVHYSTRTHMADGWRIPLRFKVHRHLVDAVAATKMWRTLPLMEYKKELQ